MKTFVNLYWDGGSISSRKKHPTAQDALDAIAKDDGYVGTIEISTEIRVIPRNSK